MAFHVGPPPPERGDFEAPRPGTYKAVIAAVWPVGLHRKEYKGKAPVAREMAAVLLQLEKKDSQGRHYLITDKVTIPRYWPSDRSAIYSYAVTAMGQEKADKLRDFWEMVGHSLQVQVGLTSGGKPKIAGILGLTEEQGPVALATHYKLEEPKGLAKWLLDHSLSESDAQVINAAAEVAEAKDPEPSPGEAGDDIPF